MNYINLVKPNLKHKIASEEMKKEFFNNNEKIINGSSLLDQMEYIEWLEHLKNNCDPNKTSKDWVTSSTFLAIRETDNHIVGIVDIRHNINVEFLSKYGGHIGYAIRPSERKKGYATAMLKLALKYSKTIGLSKVMLGCFSNNIPSKRTIEKCGGILTETKPYVDGSLMDVYWITL